MVEVLEDFVEEHSVTVIPLVKVAGFKAVFHHNFDQKEIKIILGRRCFDSLTRYLHTYLLAKKPLMLQKVAGCWTQLLLQVNLSRK
ncbi:DnaJ heat shock N-terminal domain-containing protein [Trifolium medium]|uniref:DnaJ heat shock N-terminal domain-containing protein n=1 Tax=Trifolium medium TaxID=97028 RepID=A0A392T0D9_9FABA|nr:DnaJ heat shock N-terminal domain-containing protein [Trifolium medium]